MNNKTEIPHIAAQSSTNNNNNRKHLLSTTTFFDRDFFYKWNFVFQKEENFTSKKRKYKNIF